MSDRKRKAAICCLIAASFLAMERRKKRKREFGNEYESKRLNSMMDAANVSDCDDEEEEDEENEEENYETAINSGLKIKVEPGLAEEDSISEYDHLKEDARDPLDIDIDDTLNIKQEKNYSYENSPNGTIKIKEEPDFSDDGLSENYGNDSNEECNPSKHDSREGYSKSNEVPVDVQVDTSDGKDQKIITTNTVVKDSNEARDDCQVFGDFVAGELRNLKSEDNRKKLKRIIQKVIIEISETED